MCEGGAAGDARWLHLPAEDILVLPERLEDGHGGQAGREGAGTRELSGQVERHVEERHQREVGRVDRPEARIDVVGLREAVRDVIAEKRRDEREQDDAERGGGRVEHDRDPAADDSRLRHRKQDPTTHSRDKVRQRQ